MLDDLTNPTTGVPSIKYFILAGRIRDAMCEEAVHHEEAAEYVTTIAKTLTCLDDTDIDKMIAAADNPKTDALVELIHNHPKLVSGTMSHVIS